MKKSSAEKYPPLDQAQEPDRSSVVKKVGKLILPARFFPEKPDVVEPPGKLLGSPEIRADIEEYLVQQRVNLEQVLLASNMDEIAEDVKRGIASGLTKEKAISNHNKVHEYCNEAEVLSGARLEFALADRADAIDDINRDYADIIRNWSRPEKQNPLPIEDLEKWDNPKYQNPLALDDEVMKRFFVRSDNLKPKDFNGNHFLTTYFDTAQLGLKNDSLDKLAVLEARRKELFNDCVPSGLKRLVELFIAPQYHKDFNYVNGKGMPVNTIFQQGGEIAFKLFIKLFTNENEKILTTSEEYTDMLEELRDQGRLATLEKGEQLSEEAIVKRLQDKDVKYMLASSLSRRGSILPLEHFYKLCKQNGVHLIADVCQSIGRMEYKTPADVIIASIQKGADLDGDLNGFIMMSDDFIKRDEATTKLALDLGGLQGTLNNSLARMLVTCNPRLIGTLDADGLDYETRSKMTASVPEREMATKNVACKFAQLAKAISRNNGNRIESFNQGLVYSGDEVNKDQVGCIFECKIKGVTSTQVKNVAAAYGVSISDDYFDPWESGTSFRVCFHPFMNDDSVKILGGVLEQCCDL